MTDLITKDPNVIGGRAVFRRTRVPVETVFENLADGLSIDEICESYPSLNRNDIVAVIEAACDFIKAKAVPIHTTANLAVIKGLLGND